MGTEKKTDTGLDPVWQATAGTFAFKSRVLHVLDWLIRMLTLAAFALSGAGILFRDAIPFQRPVSGILFLLVIVMAYTALSLPVSYYRTLLMPRRMGLKTVKARTWLLTRAKYVLPAMLLLAAITGTAYWAMDVFPVGWWLITGAVVLSLALALNLFAPVAILPLFLRLTPINDAELGRRLITLAGKAGAAVIGVYTTDRPGRLGTANAMLIGMGRNRRIILSGPVTHAYSQDEIEAMIAHEMGHAIHRDIPRLMAVQLLTGAGGVVSGYLILTFSAGWLGLSGISDVAGLPLVMMGIGIFALLSSPLVSAYMRRREEAADSYALRLTENADAFISLMTKLANQNLNEANPGRLAELVFCRHPSYRRRVERAVRYREQAFKGALQCSG